MSRIKRVAITGASGYIGTQLTLLALGRGLDVVMASRRRPQLSKASWVHYDLTSSNSTQWPAGIDAIVHLAVNSANSTCLEEEWEVVAAQRLIKAAHENGAKFIFVSSQTARIDAPTAYGRTKWRIEQEVLSAGGWVVRPGQVYGGELSGLFGMLAKLVRSLPILPAFVPAPMVQPIHVNDLSEGLLRIVESNDLPSGIYCLAAPLPITFKNFLGEIAKSRLRCWRGFVPAPVVVINTLAYALGKSLRTRLGLERLRSLFDLPLMPTASDLKQLGLTLRPFRSGMHPSGNDRRRRLLQEGHALLTYVLKVPASGALLRRYVRAIEKLRDGSLLALPQIFVRWPVLLALVDGSSNSEAAWGREFLWRLDSATILAEATPMGAKRFLGIGDRCGVVTNCFSIIQALISEVSWRILGMLFSPVIRLTLSRSLAVHSDA